MLKPEPPDFFEKFKISRKEFDQLVEFRKNPESRNRATVFLVGVLFTVVALAGSLLGYIRAYNRFFRSKSQPAYFYPMAPITRVAMILGAIIATAVLWTVISIIQELGKSTGQPENILFYYLVINAVLTAIAFLIFSRWQTGINNSLAHGERFGSARFARVDELYTLENNTGFYIGQGHAFDDKGHILTVAGTRGGKGTNLIIPNLLGAANIETSWIVIDPKGENAAITANYQNVIKRNVVLLNPWALLDEYLDAPVSYNPLDMLTIESPHLVDDIQVIAEMIVPIEHDAKDRFWTDSARTIVSGLLLHLVTSQPTEKHTLKTLWEWARLVEEDWDKLIQDMAISSHAIHGDTVNNAGREILKLQGAGEETFGGIISSVLQATDFLKSPALQKSLESGFDPKILADGKTTLYVIIPADKLKSHGRWLRLVVTSMMRAVIRKPNKRVTFLLDEFAALGYLPEIETALSTYAGYNVTVWPILQSLIQLKNLYKDNWETFIANCTIRQYFTINDNFSADYISKALGETSHVITKSSKDRGVEYDVNKRALVTPDELRRESGKKIFMFIGDLPPTYVEKLPYYSVHELNIRADKNPYI
jgi:type IV secretion system protein VirD4